MIPAMSFSSSVIDLFGCIDSLIIIALDYVPTDSRCSQYHMYHILLDMTLRLTGDGLRAQFQTQGVSEYRFRMKQVTYTVLKASKIGNVSRTHVLS